MRLGIPLVVFIQPFADVQGRGVDFAPRWDMGPMWFVGVLLVFSLLYAGWRALRTTTPRRTRLRFTTVAALVGVLAATGYLWRIAVPSGSDLLNLPTPDYLPQYAVLFGAGVLARRKGWAEQVTARAGRLGPGAAAVSAVLVGPVLAASVDEVGGGGTWQSARCGSRSSPSG